MKYQLVVLVVAAVALLGGASAYVLLQKPEEPPNSNDPIIHEQASALVWQEVMASGRTYAFQLPSDIFFCPPRERERADDELVGTLWKDFPGCDSTQDAPDAFIHVVPNTTDVQAVMRAKGAAFLENEIAKPVFPIMKQVDDVTVIEATFDKEFSRLLAGRVVGENVVYFQVNYLGSPQASQASQESYESMLASFSER
jgi:hypothetical protein